MRHDVHAMTADRTDPVAGLVGLAMDTPDTRLSELRLCVRTLFPVMLSPWFWRDVPSSLLLLAFASACRLAGFCRQKLASSLGCYCACRAGSCVWENKTWCWMDEIGDAGFFWHCAFVSDPSKWEDPLVLIYFVSAIALESVRVLKRSHSVPSLKTRKRLLW